MDISRLHEYLDHPDVAAEWLKSWGIVDPRKAHANLLAIATAGVTLDLLGDICDQLAAELPRSSDPDMALNNLERFVAASRSPLSLAALFERDRDALPVLLQIFSTSQFLSELLIVDPHGYDLLRVTEGQPAARDVLAAELASEIDALVDEYAVLTALRRTKRRETLRISYGDIIRGQRVATVTAQISYLADAIVEGAVRFARRQLEEKRGRPLAPDGRPARFVVLAMGKLGGVELNYSSDIDLIFLYDRDGHTDGPRPLANSEFFGRMSREVVKLLTERTELGAPYRVDLRLRPEGERGPVVHSLDQALHYYDVLGRTWERQAYVKARPIAGDLDLGREFLAQLEPWIYRRYLSLADITGIKALKRRIEHRAIREGTDARDVKTGRGGIRDVEFSIQFLQLLNGGDLPEVRTVTTLDALARLESVGCLTQQERSLLDDNYCFLRRVEHRLQIMFDLQTHLLPTDPAEVRRLAIRLGYQDGPGQDARQAFETDYQQTTALNRKILDHLLHDAFGDDAETEPEVDLILDPAPTTEQIKSALARYPFRDAELAYRNLVALSTERIRFLSTRRCRHFLASIAPRLLKAIAETPDPDSTLTTLEKVSDSLGGKGVLWELFSFNPPSMHLYVELCSTSPYLSGLLVSNPGMIDELMDSLVLNRLPSLEDLRTTLADLLHGAEDVDPILHSFKNTQQLHVGVRNILGKEDIETTIEALSNIAETCLGEIARIEYERLVEKFGAPVVDEGPRAGERCRWVIVGLGKLGGRELNYHSDLDVAFLYEADGHTAPLRRTQRDRSTNNNHFFSELAQRIIKTAGQLGAYGRLYEIDPRLRPTGRSGVLAMSFAEFARYFAEGAGQLWERQALTRARVVVGTPEAVEEAEMLLASVTYDPVWSASDAAAIRGMRARMEETAGPTNLKRGPGGIVDIEFLAQLLLLKHGKRHPEIRSPNTGRALAALCAAGLLAADDFEALAATYRFLRTIECRMRLMNSTARDDLPGEAIEGEKLARALGFADREALTEACRRRTDDVRARFERIFRDAGA